MADAWSYVGAKLAGLGPWPMSSSMVRLSRVAQHIEHIRAIAIQGGLPAAEADRIIEAVKDEATRLVHGDMDWVDRACCERLLVAAMDWAEVDTEGSG